LSNNKFNGKGNCETGNRIMTKYAMLYSSFKCVGRLKIVFKVICKEVFKSGSWKN